MGGCGQRGRCPSRIGVSVDHLWLLFVLLATLPNARTAPSSQNQAIRKNSTIPQSNFYYSWGPSPEFPKQLSCIPFRFSCGGLRKGLLTFGTRVKRPFAQSAARHPKIEQSHKSYNNAPKFQLVPGARPKILILS